jgi:hypothetical protein
LNPVDADVAYCQECVVGLSRSDHRHRSQAPIAIRIAAPRPAAAAFLVRQGGSEVKAQEEETRVELLLSEPEIVAWLAPDERDDGDGEKATAARMGRR